MRYWHRFRELCRTLFQGTRVSRELDDELNDWVERLAARHRAQGLADAEARRRALIEMGGLAKVKDEAQSVRNGNQVESTTTDLKYAWRALRRAPGFTAAAVLTFALGIGATTAIFSVVRAVLIEPLPYRESDRLLFIWADLTDIGYPHAPLAGPEVAEFQAQTSAFQQIGGVWATNATLAGDGDAEQLRIATVTADFFPLLGVEAMHGRVIGPDDFGQPVTPVLLSHGLWRRSFGADPAVVGRKVSLNDRPAVVLGVMGPDFKLLFPQDAAVPDDLEAWIPGGARLAAQPRGQQYLRVVGRLKPDARIADGIEQVASAGQAIIQANPGSYTPGSRFYAVPMLEDNVRPVRPALLAIFGGVLILLVIACVNIAGLLIVRAAARRKETSVRLAMGGSWGRLLRQYLVEGLLLSAAGTAVGIVVARMALAVLTALAPASLGRVRAADLDVGVLAFTAITALVWGLAFSLMPWAEVRRADLASVLQHDPRGSGTVVRARVRSALVTAQVALGLVLLVGAGLFARTFDRLLRLDPGFRSEGVLTFRVAPPFSRYPSRDAQNTFHRDLSEKLRALPGVAAVGAISHLPYDNLPNWAIPYLPMGEMDGSKSGLADARTVAPGFFETVGARLLAGRFFDEHDQAGPPVAVVIDDLLAMRLFAGTDPLGQQFKVDLGGSGQMVPLQVIGIVSHLRHRSITDRGREQLFVPGRVVTRNPVAYTVRTTGELEALMPAVREAVRGLDSKLPVYDMRPLDDYLAQARGSNLFTMILAGTFAAIALILACVGIYGVIAYAVSRRAREFGVRLALGARPAQVVTLVMKDGLRLLAMGTALGLAGAFGASRLLQSQLFDTAPHDPAAYAAAVVVLGAAALLACLVPARRASRTMTLRDE